MLRKKLDGVEWLEFDLLADIKELRHAVFLRHGGFSTGNYSSLNSGFGTADDHKAVLANHEKMREILQFSKIAKAKQRHDIQIAHVTKEYQEQECDGLLTTEKDIGLMIGHADCQAAIFYDPVIKVIANVHCGWRGNVKNIYAQAVAKLKAKGSQVENLLVCISPSLGPDAAEFINYKQELPESFLPFQIKPTYFNLWEISRSQLKELGILENHIEIAGICTRDNAQDFFSYRREKESGRNATIVGLRS